MQTITQDESRDIVEINRLYLRALATRAAVAAAMGLYEEAVRSFEQAADRHFPMGGR